MEKTYQYTPQLHGNELRRLSFKAKKINERQSRCVSKGNQY